ncbi:MULTISPECIES: DUF4365 domain-containing protein [Kitasatospora]|uniref:DUF4365 domain-containing protein n=1 Tax=Kitasatospora setae (strain ATCC 33774 / DSM 43861 / JCM 3304 / KCC A-0304 / NBRC 14216 / KM-6054) TaxID=452652 RepID=E4N9D5_KITSK|nr:DUF4365 domain-containing protein [Kitasatospora setae]BAJ27816.1 hypothetical protein KSE_19930 [Kitasatospora setae KM-6054]
MHGSEEPPYCGLTPSAAKEQVSLGWLTLVTSAAGCSLSDPRTDYNGWDVTVFSHAEYRRFTEPGFDVQLKATSSASVARRLSNGDFSFSLDTSTYQKLRNPKRYNRALLVVLILPPGSGPADWAVRDESGLRSPGIMLWSDPLDWTAEPADGQGSVTVTLGRNDHFDPEFIQKFMKELGDGGSWR